MERDKDKRQNTNQYINWTADRIALDIIADAVGDYHIPGRAYTPEQKRAIIERLYNAWLLMPEMRLTQLIKNVYGEKDIFYVEDEPFVENIEGFVNEHTR